MNIYCKSALHQIKFALIKTIEIADQLTPEDLHKRPTPDKHSIRELLEHLALICQADLLIASGASQQEMDEYYAKHSIKEFDQIKKSMLDNYSTLEETYLNYSDEELKAPVTSFWGVTYTRYEWLLEIVAHLYHHRGQLHAILVHYYKMDLRVQLFE
ncbi:DinB family protein [Alkalicoccobacillus porphyridii]|uniref:DinB family protein n=1 Tax=Alkalicoccobacillus porphyridii TaxID=2597270 RepID=A0A553ZWX0_9BACI|nr:DinB family protein [Alkalicoccobacillus porphyridii]TSB45941.1 DinB family protein [Alkalicoccobacillus porphyridii]